MVVGLDPVDSSVIVATDSGPLYHLTLILDHIHGNLRAIRVDPARAPSHKEAGMGASDEGLFNSRPTQARQANVYSTVPA
jgi:hypothetical protein